MRIAITKAIAITLLLIGALSAQATDYRSRLLRPSDGLNSVFVRDMAQDSTGFIWFATLNGLCRYDGYTMKEVINRQTVNEGIVPDNRLVNIYLWGSRFLWGKLRGNLFVCYDLQENNFVRYAADSTAAIPFRTGTFANPQEAWLFDRVNGCRRITFDGQRFYTEDFTAQDGQLPSGNVCFVRQGLKGRTWIATAKGLVLYENHKVRTLNHSDIRALVLMDGKEFFVSANGQIEQFADGRLKVLVAGSPSFPKVNDAVLWQGQHRIVIATQADTYEYSLQNRQLVKSETMTIKGGHIILDNRGNSLLWNTRGQVVWLDGKGDQCHTMNLFETTDRQYPDLRLQAVTTQTGEIWMSTYGQGLYIYTLSTGRLRAVEQGKGTNAIISTLYLRDLMEDRNGNVWISQEDLGVSCSRPLDGHCRELWLYPPTSPKYRDLRNNTVQTLHADADGKVWIVNKTGDLMMLHPNLSIAPDKMEGMSDIFTSKQMVGGKRCIGTRDSGLFVDGRQYQHSPDDPTSLSANRVSDMTVDKKGRLWISVYGGGLDMAEPDGQGGLRFRHFFQGSREEREARTVMTDHRGHLWSGTGEGLRVFSPDGMLADSKNYRLLQTNSNIKMDEVHDIFEDSAHRVWVCISGSGVILYDNTGAQPKLLRHFTIFDGLGDNMAQSVTEDRHGNVWIGTNHGVSKYDRKTDKMHTHIYSNIPWGNICMERAACTLADGQLLFGTKSGLLVVDPEIDGIHQHPQLAITDLQVNGVSLEKRLQDITLGHSENSLTFYFTDFIYDEDKTSRYTYILKGIDKEWSTPSIQHFATYKNLPPGRYTFMLRTYDRQAAADGAEVSLVVTISPPWWATWWAYLIYIIIAAAIIYMLYLHFKRINELHNKIKVEQQVAEYKVQFFTGISHEFRTPLTIIQGAMERIRQTGDIPGSLKQPVGNMQKSVKRMSRLISRLMDFRKIQENRMTLAVEETDVVSFLRDIWATFRDLADNKRINLQFNTFASSYKMPVDIRKLDSIAYNLISNALKYTPTGGQVVLQLALDETSRLFTFEVTDSGIGISPERQQQLFQQQWQSAVGHDSVGIGLNLSYRLAQLHKGQLAFRDNPEGGSVFTLTLPADGSAYSKDDYASDLTTTIITDSTLADPWLENYKETAPPPLNDRTLLIVEDDDDVREYLVGELRSYFVVVEATNGSEAWEHIREQRPDIVLSDVAMPLMNGFELTQRIKKDKTLSDIPVVLLTAFNDDVKRERGFTVGADDYIQKPFSVRTLVARLSQLLEQRDKLRNSYSSVEAAPVVAVVKEDRDRKFLSSMDAWIYGHLSDTTMNVDELAEKMGFGRSSFYRKVNALTGMTPNNYIRRIRMEESKKLLAETNLTVSEVAYKTGFNNAFYFSKCFKEYYGMAPSRFRNGEATSTESGSTEPTP